MGITRLLKPALFFYECIKFLGVAGFVFFRSWQNSTPEAVFIAPTAIFPIMTLFIWLDVSRYKTYIPLFIAGKCIGISALIVWIVISAGFSSAMLILSCDLFAIAAVLLISKSEKNDNANFGQIPPKNEEDNEEPVLNKTLEVE